MRTHYVELYLFVDPHTTPPWIRRKTLTMPELTHYGYDGGTNYCKSYTRYRRELMRRAKAAVGLTGVRGTVSVDGDTIVFRPHRGTTVMFISDAF